jgi:hypothetical protein
MNSRAADRAVRFMIAAASREAHSVYRDFSSDKSRTLLRNLKRLLAWKTVTPVGSAPPQLAIVVRPVERRSLQLTPGCGRDRPTIGLASAPTVQRSDGAGLGVIAAGVAARALVPGAL